MLLLRKGATWKIQLSKLGLLWFFEGFPSAPWAMLVNKFRQQVFRKMFNQRCFCIAWRKFSNACRGHGEGRA